MFQLGDFVQTKSGLTRGEVVEVPDDEHIDVLSSVGNRYRNCLADMWVLQVIDKTGGATPPHILRRLDRCHIIVVLDGEEFTMSGAIIAGAPTRVFVQIDGAESHWIERKFVYPGEGRNDL